MAGSGRHGERSCGIRQPDELADVDTWVVAFEEYEPAQEGRRESLCTLANGYWGTRGASEESVADDVHYPGTYFAGVYDEVDGIVDGVEMPGEEVVNAPNWLRLQFRLADDGWFDIDSFADADLLEFRQELDVRHGILTRNITVRDREGRVTTIRLWFHPLLPVEINAVSFHLTYRDLALSVTVTQAELHIVSVEGHAAPVRIVVEGTEFEIGPGEERIFPLLRADAGPSAARDRRDLRP
ncbi:glycosyl hydrolase family 65 protein [Microbacterium sp. ZW CA_36]|uniref:glycosyl hydrolase family 65 protein n=1 Tax=Microbacterium sp. ZW CA_36 TaxID=3378078 RepID=UPI0038536DF6